MVRKLPCGFACKLGEAPVQGQGLDCTLHSYISHILPYSLSSYSSFIDMRRDLPFGGLSGLHISLLFFLPSLLSLFTPSWVASSLAGPDGQCSTRLGICCLPGPGSESFVARRLLLNFCTSLTKTGGRRGSKVAARFSLPTGLVP